jgi:hypothetical protein
LSGIVLFTSGCASLKPRDAYAVINDCSGGGYRVVAVDGQPAVRANSVYTTMIPVVVVPAGTHQVTVYHDREQEEFEVTATLAANLAYRIEKTKEEVEIIPRPYVHPDGFGAVFGDYRANHAAAEAQAQERAEYMFYDHEFENGSDKLTPRAIGHLEHVAQRLPHAPFAVVVQRSPDDSRPELDEARRQTLIQELKQLGVKAQLDERLVIDDEESVMRTISF